MVRTTRGEAMITIAGGILLALLVLVVLFFLAAAIFGND